MNADHPSVGSPIASPIGHWKLDEGFGTRANNSGSSGPTLNGTLTSMSSPATATSGWTDSGKFSKALSFDGSNDYVNVTDIDYGPGNVLSISAWFKYNACTGNNNECYIVAKAQATSSTPYTIRINTSGNTCIHVHGTASCSGGGFNDGAWHHVVGIVNNTNLLIYLDGILINSNTGASPANNNDATAIGGSSASPTHRPFNGQIDEVKIYNYVLSADEVKAEYNQGKAIVLGALSTESDGTTASNAFARGAYCPPGDTTTCNPPIGHWTFDERQGTTANDISGNANTGTLTNDPLWYPGILGQGIKFDGVNDYVNVGTLGSIGSILDNGLPTFSAWIKSDNRTTGFMPLGAMNTGGLDTGIQLGINQDDQGNFNLGYISLYLRDENNQRLSGYVATNTGVTDGNWHHVAWIPNPPSTEIRIYLDGVRQAITYNHVQTPATTANFNVNFLIGAENDVGTPFGFANAVIDDVRIYNYARAPAQIAWDYNQGKPLAHYKFDECSGTTAYDSSGTGGNTAGGKNGTWSGSSGSNTSAGTCSSGTGSEARNNGTNSKFGSGLDFDGTDDVVTVTNTSAIDLNEGLQTGLTMAAWVYPNSDGEGNEGRIFDKGSGNYCRLGSQSGSQINVECQLNLTTEAVYTASTKIQTGEWSHIALSWTNDADDEITIWVNGIPHTSTATFDGDPVADANNFLIGNEAAGSATFDGKIDDVRIYNFELNPPQIKTLINEGSAIRFGPETGSP
jgi:hypothetical protein